MRTPSFTLLALLLALSTALAGPQAEQISILSETLIMQDRTGDVIFEGKVRVSLPDADVSCDRLTVRTSREDLSRVLSGTATGHVVLTREMDRVEADEAHFDLIENTVELTGSPRLSREGTSVEAERIIYRLEKGTATFFGPVRAVFVTPGQ
ncbi:MAG: hypothetical protein JSV00_02745 [bacterium]|nr:MAG: hypothetical protein JSV00_02745 [bacterium]